MIYTAEEFNQILTWCEWKFTELLPYVVLSGFCFLRTAELVRKFSGEKILRWEDVHWDDGLIHVPVGVAKATKRDSGDERYIPLNDAAKRWLAQFREDKGECVPVAITKFTRLWVAMTDKAGVPRVDSGLRHSAISYSLAAYPENGVALTSQWAGNSEATIRKHYRRLLKPAQGEGWFKIAPFAKDGRKLKRLS